MCVNTFWALVAIATFAHTVSTSTALVGTPRTAYGGARIYPSTGDAGSTGHVPVPQTGRPRYTNFTQQLPSASGASTYASGLSGSSIGSILTGTGTTIGLSTGASFNADASFATETQMVPTEVTEITVVSGTTTTFQVLTGGELPSPITLQPSTITEFPDAVSYTYLSTSSTTSQAVASGISGLSSDLVLLLPRLEKISKDPKPEDEIGPLIKEIKRIESTATNILGKIPKPPNPGKGCVASIWNLLGCVIDGLEHAHIDIEGLDDDDDDLVKEKQKDLENRIIPELTEWEKYVEDEEDQNTSTSTSTTCTKSSVMRVTSSCRQVPTASSITEVCETSTVTVRGCSITGTTTGTTFSCKLTTARTCTDYCPTTSGTRSCTMLCSTITASCASDATTTTSVPAVTFPPLEQYPGPDVDSQADIDAMAVSLESLFASYGLVEITPASYGSMGRPSASVSLGANRTSISGTGTKSATATSENIGGVVASILGASTTQQSSTVTAPVAPSPTISVASSQASSQTRLWRQSPAHLHRPPLARHC